RRWVVVHGRGVLIRQRRARIVEFMATGQRTPLLKLADSVAFGQGRPAHVGEELGLAVEGRHQPLRCARLGAVEIVHGSFLPRCHGVMLGDGSSRTRIAHEPGTPPRPPGPPSAEPPRGPIHRSTCISSASGSTGRATIKTIIGIYNINWLERPFPADARRRS